MTDATLAVSAASGLAAAALFAYVGLRLGRRVVTTPEGRAAFTCFRAWWYAVAIATLLTPVRLLLYVSGLLTPWMYAASTDVSIVVACIGLWALLCNLVYLYTGSIRSWGPFAFAYFLVAAMFLGLLSWTGLPTAIQDDGWNLRAATPHPLPVWGALLALLVLLGPQLVAALAYLRLLRHAPGPTQRYRIVLVSSSIILWFGSTIAATLAAATGFAAFLVSRLVGVVAALLVLAAYDPPRALQERLGVRRAGEELAPGSGSEAPAGTPGT